MDREAQHGWQEAFRLDAEGDPRALAKLLLESVPAFARERAAAVLAKLPRASAKDINLADAVMYFESVVSGVGYSAALSETCARFRIEHDVFDTARRRERNGTNKILKARGWGTERQRSRRDLLNSADSA